MDKIGETIKEQRLKAGLTLKELAALIGTTSSYLSQVEHNKTIPSLPVLKEIADALNTKISYILGEEIAEETKSNYVVIKKDERKTVKSFGEGLKLQFLSTLDKNNRFEPTIHVLAPFAISGTPPYQHEGQEFVMCLKGKIKLYLSNTQIILAEGDTCYFDSNMEHSFENVVETDESEILCVSCPGFF